MGALAEQINQVESPPTPRPRRAGELPEGWELRKGIRRAETKAGRSAYWGLITPSDARFTLVRRAQGWQIGHCAPPQKLFSDTAVRERFNEWARERGLRDLHTRTRDDLIQIICQQWEESGGEQASSAD